MPKTGLIHNWPADAALAHHLALQIAGAARGRILPLLAIEIPISELLGGLPTALP